MSAELQARKQEELYKVLAQAISKSELGPFQRAVLRIRCRNATVLFEVQQFILEQAVQESVLTASQASEPTSIDWDKLLEFITKLIPLILQLISMF